MTDQKDDLNADWKKKDILKIGLPENIYQIDQEQPVFQYVTREQIRWQILKIKQPGISVAFVTGTASLLTL